MDNYDVIIVGAGPAGSSSAFFHAKKGKKVLLIDKESFPRDKICGDGVTGKSLKILNEMGLDETIAGVKQISCNEVLLTSPNKTELRIGISSPNDPLSAFCVEREIFDEVIFNKASEEVLANGGKILHERVKKPIMEMDETKSTLISNTIIGVETKEGKYYAPLTIGAGGYNCPVSRVVLNENGEVKQNRKHYSSAIREYWQDISENSGEIEIHFIDGILPGYFWIFPLSENKFNIGLGMLLEDMDKQSVKLKQMMDWVVEESFLAPRFKDAVKIEKTRKGWMLPMGSPRRGAHQPRKNYMDGALLIGDAASLIDPFTGEGIGNALLSGKLSAEYETISDSEGDEYQKKLWDMIGKELTTSHRLQKMIKRTWLFNWLFKKAQKKEKIQNLITEMLHNKESQKNLTSKWFLFKTLFF